MTDAPSKSFTSRKLTLLNRAMADPRMSAGQYRFFMRTIQGCNEKTDVASVSDQALVDDVPDCSSGDTAKAMRKKIAALGYFSFTPGNGRTRTEYRFNWDSNKQIDEVTKAKARRRAEHRAAKDRAWRDRVSGTGLLPPREGDGGTGLSAEFDNTNSTPKIHREGVSGTGGGRVSGTGQRVMQDPPYTLETPSTETPSYRATEVSRYLQGDHVDSDGLIIPRNFLSRLGDGDVDRGRELADQVPAVLLSKLLDRSSRFGVTSIAAEIDSARKQAIASIERRASA